MDADSFRDGKSNSHHNGGYLIHPKVLELWGHWLADWQCNDGACRIIRLQSLHHNIDAKSVS